MVDTNTPHSPPSSQSIESEELDSVIVCMKDCYNYYNHCPPSLYIAMRGGVTLVLVMGGTDDSRSSPPFSCSQLLI